MIKAVIFDMDGVIADTSLNDYAADSQVLKRVGIDMTQEKYFEMTGVTSRERYEKALKEYNIEADIDAMQKHRDEIMPDIITQSGIKPRPEFLPLVKLLRDNNLKVSLATSSRSVKADALLDYLGVSDIFDAKLNGDGIKHNKPAPDIYAESVRLLGLDASECVAIEDSFTGVESAKGAGLFCIGLRTERTAHQNMSKANIVVDSLSKITIEKIQNLEH